MLSSGVSWPASPAQVQSRPPSTETATENVMPVVRSMTAMAPGGTAQRSVCASTKVASPTALPSRHWSELRSTKPRPWMPTVTGSEHSVEIVQALSTCGQSAEIEAPVWLKTSSRVGW